MNTKHIGNLFFYFFIIMCFTQVITIFLKINSSIVSYYIYALFGFSFLFIIISFQALNSRFFLKNILLILLILFITFYYNLFFLDMYDYWGRGGVSTVTTYTFGILAWFFIGCGFAFSMNYLAIKRNMFWFLISIFLVSCFIFQAKGISEIDYSSLSVGSVKVDHLVLGSFLVYIICLTHSQVKGLKLTFIFLFNSLVLFMSGGRSDFFVYVLSALIFYFIFNKVRVQKIVPLSLILLTIVFIVLNNLNFEKFDRFSNLNSDDTSVLARQEILIANIKDLPNKIFVSDPNYLVKKHGNLGEYIHNLLSAWEFYGFIVFIFVVFISISNLKFLFKNKNIIMSMQSGKFAIFIFIFSFSSVIFSKVVFYYPFWFSLGFLAIFRMLCVKEIANIKNASII